MFSFLNAGFLVAAAAALIPLIIHLFSRRKVKLIDFSSLKHLKAMQRRQVRRLKIRQLLLLILRMLIILMVVLAFAEPTTTGGNIGSHASVSAVIIFDNSASMNRYVKDGNLFDLTKDKATELMQSFGEGDHIAIVSSGISSSESGKIEFSSPAAASEKIQLISPGYGPTKLESGLTSALELLNKAINLNKEIYILSDLQRNSLLEEQLIADSSVSLYFVELSVEENDNLTVLGVSLGGKLLIPGQPFEITATIKNQGGRNHDDVIASLFVNGSRVSQVSVKIAAGKEKVVRFGHTLSRGGFHSGLVQLSDDKFAADNSCYFSFNIPEQFNVLIIDGDPISDLMQLALVPSQTTGQYWSVKKAQPDNLLGINFRDYDVVMLAGAPRLDNSIVSKLKLFVKSGRSLFISYGEATDITSFNKTWGELTGVEFEAPMDKNFSGAGYYSLGYVDINHPVFSIFNLDENKLPELKFFTLPKTRITGNSKVIMRFTGDRPALIENSYFAGRVLTFAGPMSPAYSDLAGHAFFVPFMARISEYLASQLSAVETELRTGSSLSRSFSASGALNQSIELVKPDSSVVYLSPEEGQGAVTYNVVSANLPGIYRAFFDRREVDRFAVNIDPLEGNLSPASPEQFAEASGIDNYHILNSSATLQAEIAQFRFGKELWQLFLWIAAFLILIELLLSRSAPAREQP